MATADRVLSLLDLFTIERRQWTVEDAALELGWSVSTTYRYVRSLSSAGLIAPYTPGCYVLGPAIIQYDRLTRHFDPLISTARPVMARLAASCGVAGVVMLCRLFRDRVMCVHQEVGGQPDFAISFERGQSMPLFKGATSKAIFANLPPRFLRQYCARRATELAQAGLGADAAAVRAALRNLRGKVCISHGELDAGIVGVAVPILDPRRELLGSLGLVFAAQHLPSNIQGLADLVAAAGKDVSATFAQGKMTNAGATNSLTRTPAPGSSDINSREMRKTVNEPHQPPRQSVARRGGVGR